MENAQIILFHTNVEGIDTELFYRYISEFPCLNGMNIRLDQLELCREGFCHSHDDVDSSAQELALDCILELLSGGDFQITWKDIFDIFGKEDQDAFIRIMTHHSRMSPVA